MKRFFVSVIASAMTFLLLGSCSITSKTAELSIRGSVGQIKGTMCKPAALDVQGKCPMVILFHGLTGNRNENLHVHVSDSLVARGIATLRFDFNAHGESEGDFEDMTVINELQDALMILKYAESLDFVSSIGIYGHSQGGLVAGLLAPAVGAERIRCAALLGSAGSLPEAAREGRIIDTEFDPVNPPEFIEVWNKRIGLAYIKTAQMIPVYEEAAKYQGKVLLVHGLDDYTVLPEVSEEYNRAFPSSELQLIEGTGHTFRQCPDKAASIVAEFFERELR